MNRSALRALARYARRSVRRAVWRSLLVGLLVALPIAGLVAGGIVLQTAVPTPEEFVSSFMGTADLMGSVAANRALAGGSPLRFPSGSIVGHLGERSDFRIIGDQGFNLRIQEPSGPIDEPPFKGMYMMLEGRAPEAHGEAAVHPFLLEGRRVGDTVRVGDLLVRVTGTIAFPYRKDLPVVVGRGTLTGDEGTQLLVDLPPGLDDQQVLMGMVAFLSRRSSMIEDHTKLRGFLDVAAFAGSVTALATTGLICAAAFGVGARRQLRELGLLGAAGADSRHVRAVVLLGGTTLGLAGSLAGVAAGTGIAAALYPRLDDLIGRYVGPFEVPVVFLAGAIVLGTGAATVMALVPAGWAARISTRDALNGQTPPPKPPGRMARIGIGLAVLGAAVLARGSSSEDPAEVTMGCVLLVAGLLMSVPLLVSGIGRLAGRLPSLLRLAARDAARQGRRTAAAVAAASVALAVPIGVATVVLAEEEGIRRRSPLTDRQIVVSQLSLRVSPQDVRHALGAEFPDAEIASLTRAVRGVRTSRGIETVSADVEELDVSQGMVGARLRGQSVYIADPPLLRALGVASFAPALRRGTVLVLGMPGRGTVTITEHPSDVTERAHTFRLPFIGVRGHASSVLPRFLVSDELARRMGYRPERGGALLLTLPRAVREEHARAAETAIPGSRLHVQTAQRYVPSSAPLRRAVTAAGIAGALAIVAVAVALVAAESRREDAIVAAIGASPGARRGLAGARAALLCLCAGTLSIPCGFVPIAVIQSAREESIPIVMPWQTSAWVLVGAPLIALLATALIARTPRPANMLHPIA